MKQIASLSSAPVKGAAKTTTVKPRQTLQRVADNLYRSDASGIIYAIISKDGRQIRRSLKTGNKDIARARLEKLRGEILEVDTKHHDAELGRQCFKDAAECWLQSVAAALRPNTAARRQSSIKALAVHFPQSIAKITRADVDNFSMLCSPTWLPRNCDEIGLSQLAKSQAI